MTERMLQAKLLLAIWNPDLWRWFPDKYIRTKQQLNYKARGIVLHDRALNGETN